MTIETPPNKPNSQGLLPVLASLAQLLAGDSGGRSSAKEGFRCSELPDSIHQRRDRGSLTPRSAWVAPRPLTAITTNWPNPGEIGFP